VIRARLAVIARRLSLRAADMSRARTQVIVAAVVFALLLPLVAFAATSSMKSRADNFAGKSSARSGYGIAATPDPPTDVFAKAPTGNATFVNWSPPTIAPTGTVSYEVWRADSEGAPYNPLGTTTGGVYATSYVDTTTVSTKRYWYAVKTVVGGNKSAPSTVSAAVWPSIAPTTGPPARPGDVSASTTGTIMVTWRPSSDAAGYYVLRGSSSTTSSLTTMTPIPLAYAFYKDVTAYPGMPYYYTVVAVDASGTLSPKSVEAEGRAVDTLASGQPEPHKTGTSESGCLCHAMHTAAGPTKLTKVPGDSSSAICDRCHTPATALGEFLDPLWKSGHSLAATVSVDKPFTCMTCHVPVYNSGFAPASLLRVKGSWVCTTVTGATPEDNGFCYTCHGTGSTLPEGDLRVFEDSAHSTIAAPATGAEVVCDACHESHSSRNESLLKYSGYMVCMQCHTSAVPDPNAPDVLSSLRLNPDRNAKHPILPADQPVGGAKMTCQNCHNTHASTVDTPLVDPHIPNRAWAGDEKAFCFSCHDGETLPTSTQTTPWAGEVLASGGTTTTDIEHAYATNVHGGAPSADTTNTNAHLRPDMGYTAGKVLECSVCHDPHGSINNFTLRQNVVSVGATMTVGGLLVAKAPDGGYDLRFFCQSCHMWSSAVHDIVSMANTSTVSFPMDCTACHRHLDLSGEPTSTL